MNYVDEPVVVDGNLITSGIPGGMYNFSRTIAEALEKTLIKSENLEFVV